VIEVRDPLHIYTRPERTSTSAMDIATHAVLGPNGDARRSHPASKNPVIAGVAKILDSAIMSCRHMRLSNVSKTCTQGA